MMLAAQLIVKQLISKQKAREIVAIRIKNIHKNNTVLLHTCLNKNKFR